MKLFKPLFGLILLISSFSVRSFAQFNLNQPVSVDPNVKIGKLPNGITYYIQKNQKPEKKMELRLVVNAGSILEDPDQRGLAHFMEHMNFNGSKHFPKNELVDYLQKVGVKFGADLNAYTGFDETVYILPISTNDPDVVEKGFTVIEDWAGNNLLDKTEIDKERGVVLEESRLSKGAQERMRRQYFPRLLNGSRYAERLPIGKDSILKTFKPETLERFYKQWYRPDLMAVIVVGDIDPAEAEKKIIAHFSGFKNPANEKTRPAITAIPTRTKPDAMVLTDDEATNTILQIFNDVAPAKKIKTWNDYREQVKKDLINSLVNERLNELTQKENPPFIYAYTGTDQFIRGYEAYLSFAVLGNGSTKAATDALMAETERARNFGFLATELERAKANMLNEAEQAFKEKDKTNSSDLVSEYLNNFLEGNPIPGPENRYKFLQQVLPGITLNEINQVAKKIPAPTNAFALEMAPASTKGKLPSSAELEKEIVAAAKQPVKPYEEKAIATSLMEGSSLTAGKILSETKNEKLGTTDLTLSNGITITLKPTNFKNDEIQMDAWRWGGWQKFPLEDKYNAQYAAQIVNEMGIKDMTPTDLQKFLSGKTVQVIPYINDYEEGIQGSSSVKDFETYLQLVNLYFAQPRKDEALFNSFISKQKSQLQFLRSNPRFFFQDTVTKIIYNNNPWVTLPKSEDLDKINLDKVMTDYKQIYGNADGLHFTFVGNIDLSTAKPLLEKYLGSLPAKKEERSFKDNGIRPVQGALVANIKKGKEPQSYINILWSGETKYTSEDNLAFKALIEVLNIKIIEKLREEMSGIYGGGLGGSIQKRPYVHYTVTASIPCGPENVDKLTDALFDLIKTAQDKGIDPKDLDKVKATWKKNYEAHLQDNDTWLDNLSTAFINQTNPEDFLTYEQRVDALTTQDVQKAAQKFLSTSNYIKSVLYPENANVQEGVKKAF